jgi:lysophospholipase L1-like esterase
MLTRILSLVVFSFAAIFPTLTAAQEIALKSGQTLAFMGDSITAGGMGSPMGYCRLVISGLETNGVNVTPIAAGVSGHKSNDMLGRLERDVISKKPDWMTLSCGVNDVWHGAKGVPLDAYKTNISAIVDQAMAAGIKVMLLTSTMIGEDPANPNNQKLAPYNDFIRELAKEKKCLLADLNAEMQDQLKKLGSNGKTNLLTGDGVHMNPEGNMMMAVGVLKGLGLNADQIAKAQGKWLDVPDAIEVAGKMKISLRHYQQLSVYATQQKRSLNDILNEALGKTVESILKQPQP